MKKHSYLILATCSIFALSTLFISCGKNKRETYKQTSEDNALAEGTFSDIFNQVDDACKSNNHAFKMASMYDSPCATLSISDTISFPRILTIDYGSTNCLCGDGKYRRGKILANLSGRYRDSLTVITITFSDFFVNDNQVQGTKTVTNLGHVGTTNGTHNLLFSIKVQNASITTPTGIIAWESVREREWIEGENTPWPTLGDDVYLITGSANGTNRNGKSYTATITTPIRIEFDCKWIVSGIVEIQPEGLDIRTLDFGTGDCDNKATLKVKNKTYEITLH